MIEIQTAIQEFIKYTKNFDLNNENIKRKQGHSIRVMKISEEIAKELKWSKEEIEIACLIGLLHDIGRFEQYEKYNTFKDNESIDHGDLGVKILKENNTIRKYIKIDKYDNIIFTAIEEHNKYELNKNLPKEKEKYCKLIKDADKIDIIYESINIFWQGEEKIIEKEKITKEVLDEFMEERLIKHKLKIKKVDEVIGILSYIFDIYYKESIEIIRNEKYFEKLINKFDWKEEETKENIKKIKQKINEYITNKG